MSSNERAQHEWFDQDLDRLLVEPSLELPMAVQDRDHELVQTAVLMQRLDLNQQSEPNDRFIRDLEKQFMPNVSHLTAGRGVTVRNPIRAMCEHLKASIGREHIQHRRTSRLASAFSIVLLFAIIAATTFVAIHNGELERNSRKGMPSAGIPTSPAIASSRESIQPNASIPPELAQTWRTESIPEDEGLGSRMAVADGVVYRLIRSTNGTTSEIQALNADTGVERWRVSVAWALWIAADEHGVYITSIPRSDDTESSTVTALDKESGAERWSLRYTAMINSMSIVHPGADLSASTVLTKDGDNVATAINAITGETSWSTSLGSPQNPSDIAVVPVISDGDVVVAQATNGTLQILDLATGEPLWKLPFAGATDLAFANGVLAVLSTGTSSSDAGESALSAYSSRNGSELWSRAVVGANGATWSGLVASGSEFAVIAQSLGPPTLISQASPTESGISSDSDVKSTASFSLVFGVDTVTGSTTWVSNWGAPGETGVADALTAGAFALKLLTGSNGAQTVVVLTSSGTLGVLTSLDRSGEPLPRYRFTGSQVTSPFSTRNDFRGLVVDGTSAYLETGNGSIVAYSLIDPLE